MFGLARRLIRKGNAARAARDWDAAATAYAAALARRPGLAPIWVQYGHTLRETGRLAEALEAYRRSDALRPDQADTLLQIGRCLASLGELEPALDHFHRSIALAGRPCDAEWELEALRYRLRRSVLSRPPLPPERRLPRPPGMPESLRYVNLGTTGTCNASCVHCPTGKPETAHVPRGTMPMALYRSIIDGIAEYRLPVADQVAFGLFGDGLVDPLVVERAEYLRARLPDVVLSVNTNGAAFDPAKHGALRGLADKIALHCESVEEATYNDLMRPLRWARVGPKIERLMESFPGQVVVSVPISRRNREEAPRIKEWFAARGALEVVFDPLSSRCAEDRRLFDSLALDPHPIRCPPTIMDDLIVDCDGQVLVCCQDFRRVEPIGSLATDSFAEVLAGQARHRMRTLLDEGRHAELETCSRCYADLRGGFAPA